MRTVLFAVFDKAQQASHLQRMVWLVDDHKLSLQLGLDVGAFTLASPQPSRAAAMATGTSKRTSEGGSFAAQIGKQCGAWQQSVAKSAQSMHAPPSTPGDIGQKPVPAGQVRPASLSASATLPLGEVTP